MTCATWKTLKCFAVFQIQENEILQIPSDEWTLCKDTHPSKTNRLRLVTPQKFGVSIKYLEWLRSMNFKFARTCNERNLTLNLAFVNIAYSKENNMNRSWSYLDSFPKLFNATIRHAELNKILWIEVIGQWFQRVSIKI